MNDEKLLTDTIQALTSTLNFYKSQLESFKRRDAVQIELIQRLRGDVTRAEAELAQYIGEDTL